ncbi:MAG: HD domain-containing protein [Muribaculaceae bacterium]|nr:HD domain-containing protein [Muribaculaceae bacterium]
MIMIDYNDIIERFYTPGTPLHNVLTVHSRQVAELAAALCDRLIAAGTPVDAEFVREAAMLHDIGIVKTDAAGIHCHGTEPYIRHGVLGREMLDQLGLYRHALVCERHTGSGLTAAEVEAQQLPLPRRDFTPLSLEEKIVCYADKFYSKTHLGEPARELERVRVKMARFGDDSLARFDEMARLLGDVDTFGL